MLMHSVLSRDAKIPLTSLLLLLLTTSSCPTSAGATEDIRTVVTSRCIHYKSVVNLQAFYGRSKELNCAEVADSFITAFAYQDPCQVNMKRFDKYLSLTHHDIVKGKQFQFWSGACCVVHLYSQGGKRVVTLADTLSGYLIDGLHFCSSPREKEGIGRPGTASCPAYQTAECRWTAEYAFWAAASRDFAIKARGEVSVMLNASREEAFVSTSNFAMWELPNLNNDDVTRIDIKLAHMPGDVVRHTCESDNIKVLITHLDAKKIPHTCISNPPDLMWMLCADHRDNPECQNFISSGAESLGTMATAPSRHVFWMLSLILTSFMSCLV